MSPPFDPTRPFILFDDARAGEGGTARIYSAPREIVTADRIDAVRPALDRLRAATKAGAHVAGFLSYEAGLALEERLHAHAPESADGPLLWFGIFDGVTQIAADAIDALLPDPAGAWLTDPEPMTDYADYAEAVATVQRYIAAGDIYQANLTFAARLNVYGDPLAAYARLRAASRMGWGGIAYTGDQWLLSASPELFFQIDKGRITARPMKGTARRGDSPQADAEARAALGADAKERAENLMIVDLLRNDLSRISTQGTVHTPRLFEIETYPTIHQLTSTIEAQLAPGTNAFDVIEAIFPCGSITGAPKIRAMEVIAEVETRPRGAYTGSMGWVAPDGDTAFNVLIRTLVLAAGATEATLGLGSGIVADSRADREWRECLAKSRFVTGEQRPVDLIETMRFDPEDGIANLERHIARLGASASALGFRFDRHAARNELQSACFPLRVPARIRLMIAPSGISAIETIPLTADTNTAPRDVVLAPLPVPTSDVRLEHKSTDRAFLDEARRASGCFEVVFTDAQGFVTQGSFTSVFVERDGGLITPPLSRGLLPGVLRATLIEEGRAIEGDLSADDLAGGFWIGNAVRGLIPARLVAASRA